jgi:hypothetical protein
MAITPISTTTPYCTVENFLKLYDYRPIAQLMNDDNSTAVTRADLLDDTTDEGERLLNILMRSSGDVEMAVLAGGRITPTDLAALTGASAVSLQGLVADLAIGECYTRRPDKNPWAEKTAMARSILNALASGDLIFATQEAVDSSKLEITADTPQRVYDRQGMVVQMQGFFGVRGNRQGY